MIDTHDLRIGNYVLFNNHPVIVQGVTTEEVLIGGVPIAATDSKVNPIPLCDFILQNIRQRIYEKSRICYTYHKNSTFMLYNNDNGSYYIGLNYRGYVCHVTTTPILYLHQLQNICYAQYGEEMIIDEKTLVQCVANAYSRGLLK